MELNSLNIPETNRRDLQRLLDQAYAGYVADLDALADEAADAIEAQYRSNPFVHARCGRGLLETVRAAG